MSRTKLLVAASIAAAALAGPASAHHSFAMFDQSKTVVLKGVVGEFQWTNPHSWIQLDVAGRPQAGRWSIELSSPNNLGRQGWKRTTLKAGDVVTVTINPLRDGKKGGLFNSIVLPGGKKLGGEKPTNDQYGSAPGSN